MVFQVFLHGHLGIQGGVLEDDPDVLSYQTAVPGNVMAVDGQRTLRFVQDGTQGIDGRAFARTVWAKEGENAALVHGEGNVVHRREIPVFFLEMFHLYDCFHSCSSCM